MKVIVLTRGGLRGTLPTRGMQRQPTRSNPYREVWLNPQKSVLLIVPFEPTERIGEGRGRRLINRLTERVMLAVIAANP